MKANEHARLLGIFHLIQAGLQLFTAVLIFFIYGGMGIFAAANARNDEGMVMGGIFIVLAVVIGIVIFAFAALYAYSGWNLFKNKPHSKVWAIIVSVLCLPGIPLGTALGVYGLWFTLGDEGKAYYDGNSGQGMQGSPPPPPPNSWQ